MEQRPRQSFECDKQKKVEKDGEIEIITGRERSRQVQALCPPSLSVFIDHAHFDRSCNNQLWLNEEMRECPASQTIVADRVCGLCVK